MKTVLVRFLLVSFCFTQYAFVDDPAIEVAKNGLKSCIDSTITAGKKSKDLSAESILSKCSTELEALIALIPDAAQHDVRHQIENQVSERLTKRL